MASTPGVLLPRWFRTAVSNELRKIFAYRVDFWVNYFGPIAIHIALYYFFWSAVFLAAGQDFEAGQIAGMSFKSVMLYASMIPLLEIIVRGTDYFDFISRDIYEGSLSRYLVYPVNFFGFKLASRLGHSIIATGQVFLLLAFFGSIWGFPEEVHVTPLSFVLGVGAAFCASYLCFAVTACVEMTAFWADNVWSLLVMLRMTSSFLGGAWVPLAMFSEDTRRVLSKLPFAFFFNFPIRVIFGGISLADGLEGLAWLALWSLVFTFVVRLIWRRGLKQYTGVGM